jgi:HK97 family phage prohead protease
MHRAYSFLTQKDFSESADHVRIKGIASTPSADRYGDVVEPMGAKFVTPMPLLWQHRHAEPVGNMTLAAPTKNGIPFEAVLPIIREAGRLKDRVDEAIHSLKYGLVSAVSIGFQPLEGGMERMKEGGYRFKVWEWLELSLVTIPANSDAVITAIKSYDQQLIQRAGRSPGASGQPAAQRGPVKLIPRNTK